VRLNPCKILFFGLLAALFFYFILLFQKEKESFRQKASLGRLSGDDLSLAYSRGLSFAYAQQEGELKIF